ncbi:LysR family transcriptional regulator [Sphingomonas canadensis]|uniref:LysR family transcriptional regulator n=1 Tax=Sphingomonas canadensis TaxID=1219257 RepID=A0ABW3H7T0_9SPHN|nr:LysR family transcriptional regulator [Sphingomonas canadensis]MCW3835908.1 LysR family transcriptional regulator [Sphingomonas canadensis]
MARRDSHETLRRLDLNLLVVFDAMIRFGSITRAAGHLGMTQSAASHALKRLRGFFGDPLFVRSGQGMLPTSRAEEIGRSVAEIVAVLRNTLLTRTGFDPSLADRDITLFLHDYGELVILPALAAELRAAAPRCRIKVAPVSGDSLIKGLEEGWIDLAISGPAAFSGEVLQQRLFDAGYAVAASTAARFAEPLSAEAFAALDQVVIRPVRPDKLPVDTLLVESEMPRRERVVTPYTMAVPALLAANPDMVAIVPGAFIASPSAAGLIRRVETAFGFPSVPVFQYWHRRHHADPFSVWLRGVVRRLFGGGDDPTAPAPAAAGGGARPI